MPPSTIEEVTALKNDLASVAESADYLGCSSKTVRRYIADGRLEAFRVGARMIRVDRAALDALLRPMG